MRNVIMLFQGNCIPNITTLLKLDLNNPTKWSLNYLILTSKSHQIKYLNILSTLSTILPTFAKISMLDMRMGLEYASGFIFFIF